MVDKATQVVVFGSSLNMAGIAASLKRDRGLEVVCLDPQSLEEREQLHQLDSAAIVFDLNDTSTGLDVMLLRDRPELLLIGVDASSDKLLILSCQVAQALSVADLVNVIRTQPCATA